MADTEIAIIGAGPYGLAAAAHLGPARPVVFGRTMSFWRENMPSGMWLRSPRSASNISAPRRAFSLAEFERDQGIEPVQPLPLQTFLRYGAWFKERSGANVEERLVSDVARENGHFRLSFADGDSCTSRKVVVAGGIERFAVRPAEFAQLPDELVSHSVDHSDLSRFRGQKVIVVGAGQSAVESAALLSEEGATVELLARTQHLNWLIRSGLLHKPGLRKIFYAPTDIGPAGISWLIAAPGAFRQLPRRIQDPLAQRSIRAAASAWLVSRVEGVTIREGRRVTAARPVNEHVELTLDNGETVTGDHILLGTGYRVDIERYPFFSSKLLDQVDRVGGYPRLRRGFETNVPGLYIIGAPAAWSFGPLFRFVAGTRYAATALARSALRGRGSVPSRTPVEAVQVAESDAG